MVIDSNYFQDKKYLITGASSGIGRATAMLLSNYGASLVLTGRNVENLRGINEELGKRHLILPMDLSKEDDLTYYFNQAIADGKKLDGIVHCAGIDITEPINLINIEKFDVMMHVHIFALLEMIRLFSKRKYHSSLGGSVVAVSSVAAVAPGKCQTIYAAAKAGMNAAVQAVAQEMVSKKIRVNTIMPSFTRTNMYERFVQNVGEDAAQKVVEQQLLGLAEPEEIANTILFLLSDASSVITGRAMYTDSGTL